MLYLYVFITVILINCAYLFLFLRFALSKSLNTTNKQNTLPVSVLVYVKNNAQHLENNLNAIIEQDYPNFELILINDDSSDESLEILEAFQLKHANFPILLSNVHGNETFWGSKKYALTLGIKRAKNEYLLFTDANCKPTSNQWIQEMAAGFQNNEHVVLGYSNYKKQKGFFNLILRFDTLLNAVHYLSFAYAKMTYMGVGKNLAYTSNVYYENRGFISHVKLPVGDDDLFVNEVATKNNTSLVWNKEAHIEIEPLKKWEDWLELRKNRAWTFRRYKTKHKVILGIYFLSSFLFWLGTIGAFFFLDWKIATGLIIFRLLLQYFSMGILAKKLNAKRLIIHLPWLELALMFLQLRTAIYYITKPANNWR